MKRLTTTTKHYMGMIKARQINPEVMNNIEDIRQLGVDANDAANDVFLLLSQVNRIIQRLGQNIDDIMDCQDRIDRIKVKDTGLYEKELNTLLSTLSNLGYDSSSNKSDIDKQAKELKDFERELKTIVSASFDRLRELKD